MAVMELHALSAFIIGDHGDNLFSEHRTGLPETRFWNSPMEGDPAGKQLLVRPNRDHHDQGVEHSVLDKSAALLCWSQGDGCPACPGARAVL